MSTIQRLNQPHYLSLIEFIGFFFIPLILLLRVLFGADIFDLFFLMAEDIFYFAQFLRSYNTVSGIIIITFLFGSLLIMKSRFPKFEKENNEKVRVLFGFALGILLSIMVIYWLLNISYFRSVFMTVPFVGGILLLLLTIGMYYTDRELRESMNSDMSTGDLQPIELVKLVKIGVLVFLSLLLVVSNLSYIGLLPTPPGSDPLYGSPDNRPFEVERLQFSFQIPEDINPYIIPIHSDGHWNSYIYYPIIEDTTSITHIPIVIFLHGIGAYDIDTYYTKIMELMASRGSIAIFVQYPDDVDLTGPYVETSFDNNEKNPAYYLRYRALWHGVNTTLTALQNGQIANQQLVIAALNGVSISYDHILVTGHSYGGGATPYIASKLRENGYASTDLILDMEAPWFVGRWNNFGTNYSLFDETTIISINAYQDDFRFDMCVTVFNFDTLKSQSEIPTDQLQFIITPSDRYGFPRLVATHFVPVDPLVDALTYFGVFKRIDAMVHYLQGFPQNDLNIRNTAATYFIGGTQEMLDMGEWSDGTDVTQLYYSLDPSGQESGPDLTSYLTNYDVTYCDTFA